MRPFTWRDGERTIHFGAGTGLRAWRDADLLTTARARAAIPEALAGGFRSTHDVPAGQVPDLAAALIREVGDGPIVAWGGGRVIDTAKALAAARGGRVCAVPTTLSGAEMTRGHRPVPGYEERGHHRPVLVLADPGLMTGQADPARRQSAMNALAHAVEAFYGPGANPVAGMAAAEAVRSIAAGVDGGRSDATDRLAVGSLLAAYAMDSAGYSLHHVLCQTIVRVCGTPHAATNAVMLAHVVDAMRGRAPDEIAALAEALRTSPDRASGRVAELAGPPGTLSALGVAAGDLDRIADAAAGRPELGRLPDPPGRDELVSLLERAL